MTKKEKMIIIKKIKLVSSMFDWASEQRLKNDTFDARETYTRWLAQVIVLQDLADKLKIQYT